MKIIYIILLTLLYLAIANPVSAQGITISSGTTLLLNSSTIRLTGNWNNSGTLNPGTGTIVFSGNGDEQTITNASGETFYNMTVKNGAVASLPPGQILFVTGTLTNNADSTGLVLQSDATGTAQLINGTTGVRASVQQHIAEDNWHYTGIPFADSAKAVQLFKGLYVAECIEDSATHNSSNGWIFLDTADYIVPGIGYGLYLNEDTTVTIYGILNATEQSIDVKYSGEDHGWNLISNPFPCVVDWDYVRNNSGLTNVNDAIYVWDPGSGNYSTYVNGVSAGAETQNQYISPMQGFFVRSTAAGSITFSEECKSTGEATFKSNSINQIIRLAVSSPTGNTDNTVIRITAISTNGFDRSYDAYKLLSTSSATPQLYSALNGNDYSINSIPEITRETVIPLKVIVKTTGGHKLVLSELENYQFGYPVNLFDASGEFVANLEVEDYAFSAMAGETVSLYLGFYNSTSFTEGYFTAGNISLSTQGQNIVLDGLNNITSQVVIFNINGQRVYYDNVKTEQIIIPVQKQGVYLVKVIPVEGYVFNGKALIKNY